MLNATVIVFAVLGLAAVLIMSMFNSLIALLRRCDQASADIDVQLKQRHDLIPNLVETVKGFAGHERGTLEAVIKARAAAVSAPAGGQQLQAETALGASLGRLMAVAEAYPDLKATAHFAELQGELADIENKIAAARRYLNSATAEYNTTRQQFPNNMIAKLFGFDDRNTVVIAPENRADIGAAPAVRF